MFSCGGDYVSAEIIVFVLRLRIASQIEQHKFDVVKLVGLYVEYGR